MIKKGRGISAIMHPTGFKGGGDPDQALLKLKPDGTVDLLTGVTDYGQGGKTVLRQFAAEELGIDIDMISLHNKGTDNVTWSTDTAASRVTFIAGNAVIKAAQDFKRNLKRFAAGILNVDADDLEIDGVKIYKKDNPEIATTYADIGAASTWGGDFVVGVGAYLVPPAAPVDPITGAMDFCAAMAYAVCVADVEVDTETGYVDVVNMYTGYEIGTAVNPLLCEGQFDGGAVMGMGMAIMENLYPKYPDDAGWASSYTDYIIPTTMDCPEMKNTVVEIKDPRGPYGAKGMGEMSSNPQAPAIANAIYDAICVRMDSLPITAEKVLAALEAKKNRI